MEARAELDHPVRRSTRLDKGIHRHQSVEFCPAECAREEDAPDAWLLTTGSDEDTGPKPALEKLDVGFHEAVDLSRAVW